MKAMIMVLWALLWRAGAILAVWQLLLTFENGGKIASAESNLISNQIGMQEAARVGDPDLVLLGSSIIVRLPADSVSRETGLPEVVQMGLNGSGSLLGLRLLEEMAVRPAGLVIEANSLSRVGNQNEQTLLNHLDEGVFSLAKVIPPVRAENRPSSRLYHRLKQWRDRRLAPLAGGEESGVPLGFAKSRSGGGSPGALAVARQVRERVERLGVPWKRVLLVMLPDRGRDRSKSYEIAELLVAETGVAALDLKGREQPGDYRYADGLHLNAPGGKKASRQVARALRAMGVAPRR